MEPDAAPRRQAFDALCRTLPGDTMTVRSPIRILLTVALAVIVGGCSVATAPTGSPASSSARLDGSHLDRIRLLGVSIRLAVDICLAINVRVALEFTLAVGRRREPSLEGDDRGRLHRADCHARRAPLGRRLHRRPDLHACAARRDLPGCVAPGVPSPRRRPRGRRRDRCGDPRRPSGFPWHRVTVLSVLTWARRSSQLSSTASPRRHVFRGSAARRVGRMRAEGT